MEFACLKSRRNRKRRTKMVRETTNFAKKELAAIAFAAALVAGLAIGCTPITVDENLTAKDVLSEGIGALDERYIEPIQPDTVMMSGLAQLSNIDENLTVTRTPKSVFLAQEGVTIVERPLPASDNIDGWSELGAKILADAKRESPAFVAYSQEALLNFVFSGPGQRAGPVLPVSDAGRCPQQSRITRRIWRNWYTD